MICYNGYEIFCSEELKHMDKETRNDLPGIQWFPGRIKK